MKDLTEDDEGHSVEDGADICQAPQTHSKLDGVYEIFNKKEPSQLNEPGIDVDHGGISSLSNFVLGQREVKVEEFPATQSLPL